MQAARTVARVPFSTVTYRAAPATSALRASCDDVSYSSDFQCDGRFWCHAVLEKIENSTISTRFRNAALSNSTLVFLRLRTFLPSDLILRSYYARFSCAILFRISYKTYKFSGIAFVYFSYSFSFIHIAHPLLSRLQIFLVIWEKCECTFFLYFSLVL